MKSEPAVALVYDRVNSWGGAERVLLALHQIYPHAPLFTSVYDAVQAPWAQGWNIKTSWLQKIPFLRRYHRLLGPLMPLAFESLDVSGYDLVISVTSEFGKAVLTTPQQLHLCYLLTPTRYLWSHAEEYLASLPRVVRPLARVTMHMLRRFDEVIALRPDVYVPISDLVRQRCQTYYGRQTEKPLYPPVPQLPAPQEPETAIPASPFFFTWGRHVPYKAIDVVIRAAVANGQHLIVAGNGPMTKTWQHLAAQLDGHDLVTFVGSIADSALTWYLQHALAAVFPQEEDFGLTALEAVSQGCPVIIHAQSGAAELLRPDRDGLFLPETNVAMLMAAMSELEKRTWSRLDIKQQARQYAEAVWQTTFFDMVEQHWQQHQKENEGSA